MVSDEERSGGLVIEPLEKRLDMREHPPSPASTLSFEQFLASLAGTVTCLGELAAVTYTLKQQNHNYMMYKSGVKLATT